MHEELRAWVPRGGGHEFLPELGHPCTGTGQVEQRATYDRKFEYHPCTKQSESCVKSSSETCHIIGLYLTAGAHRELSVALIKSQGSVCRGCAILIARAAGRPVLQGAEVPFEE